jgi:hypothetical protein
MNFQNQGNQNFQGHGSRDFQGHGGSHSRSNSKREERPGPEPQRMEHISLQGNHFYSGPQDMNSRERKDQDYYNDKRDRLINKQKASLEIQRYRHEKRNYDHTKGPYDRGGHSQPWQNRPYRR